MNKPKLIFGITLTVLGCSIMLTGMILGIIHVASGSYRDIYTFPISLTQENASQQNLRFRTNGKADFSFWLKMPDRKIENKPFKFGVALVSNRGGRHASFEENFRFGYLRNGAEKGQYYRLGRYHSENEFNGYLQYRSSGNWRPASDGFIVLRRQEQAAVPLKSIGIFTIGFFGLVVGLGTITKKRWLTANSHHRDRTITSGEIHFKPLKDQDSILN